MTADGADKKGNGEAARKHKNAKRDDRKGGLTPRLLTWYLRFLELPDIFRDRRWEMGDPNLSACLAAGVVSPGMANSPSDGLSPDVLNPKGIQVINERCRFITRDGHRVVLVSGVPIVHYVQGDRMSEAHAMVSLIDLGWADQNDVAEAFGCSARTQRMLRSGRIGCAGPS